MTTASIVECVCQVFGASVPVVFFRKKPTHDICKARRLSLALCGELMPHRTAADIARDFGWHYQSAGHEVGRAKEWVDALLWTDEEFKRKTVQVIKLLKSTRIK